MTNTPDLDNEFIRDMSGGLAAAKWVVQKANPTEFGLIEKALNWNNINAVEQNQALGEILINQQQILSELNNLQKQIKMTKKVHRMTTQQLSQLYEEPRPITIIVATGAASP